MPFALAPSGAASSTLSAAEPPRAAVAREAKNPPRETAAEGTPGSAGVSLVPAVVWCSSSVAAILVTPVASLLLYVSHGSAEGEIARPQEIVARICGLRFLKAEDLPCAWDTAFYVYRAHCKMKGGRSAIKARACSSRASFRNTKTDNETCYLFAPCIVCKFRDGSMMSRASAISVYSQLPA